MHSWIVALAVLVSGCVGAIGDGSTGEDPAASAPPTAGANGPLEVDPAVVRKLNRREYVNTVRDLLGATVDPAEVPADAIVGFDNVAASLVASKAHVEQNLKIAETVAAAADLSKLVSCSDDSCADALIATLGRRAFRRPIAFHETEIMKALFTAARADGRSFDQAARMVVQAFLQSPQFLYRIESSATDAGGVQRVTPFEFASRLSYFVWASMPDDVLLDAAEKNLLETDAHIVAQVRRMLGDPRAKEMVKEFNALWLQLYKLNDTRKDEALYPTFEALRPLYRRETLDFTSSVFWEGRGSDLLRADYTFNEGARVSLVGTERRGLLGQGSILSMFGNPDRTSPTLRGRFVREQLLCQPPPPPPPGIPALPATAPSGTTMRERLAEHTSNPACMGCHNLIDPPGFGLESFDTIGRFRTEEGGKPIDNSGELRAVGGDAAGPFRGAIELSQRLSRAPEFTDCIARQWFRFAFGRKEGDGDQRTVESIVEGFRRDGGDQRALITAIAASPAFRSISMEKAQ